MTNELSKEEFFDTMGHKMNDITETSEPPIDIWQYVSDLLDEKIILDYVLEKRLVQRVYRNQNKSFDHVLLPTDNPRIFVVVVVDLIQKKIHGHYNLDLNAEYGLKPIME